MLYRKFKRQKLLEAYLPLFGHVTDNVVALNDNKGVVAMYEVSGIAAETMDVDEIVRDYHQLNASIKHIANDRTTLHFYRTRGKTPSSVYPRSEFKNAWAESLDHAYRDNLLNLQLFRNQLFIGIELSPASFAGLESVVDVQQNADALDDICSALEHRLKKYGLRRLGIRQEVFSEIAETLVYAMTGQWRPIGLTTGRLGQAMFSEDVYMYWETIEFRGADKTWYGMAFGQKHYQAKTRIGINSSLMTAPFRHTLYQSFRYLSTQDAQDAMRTKRGHMRNANDPARTQAALLETAADELASSNFVMGDHCITLLSFSDYPEQVREVANASRSLMANSGATIARETLGLEAAWVSMCPGNSHQRPRPGFISSLNLVCGEPLHRYPTGSDKGYWGGPMALFRTVSGEPYRFHPHVADVGNIFITGRIGSGKSVMIGFLIAQALRLGAQIVLWDKDCGLKILVHALGGAYLELPKLAPLKRLTNSPEDIEFLTQLIRGCIMGDGIDRPITHQENHDLFLALQTVMSMPPELRNMWEVRQFLGPDANGAGARLEKWCSGREYGNVIDNAVDVVNLDAPVIGFDQKFLDNPVTRGPILSTQFHYTDKLIDGRRLLFVVEEFWRALQEVAFRDVISNQLKARSRKGNSPTILCTQSPRDALNSPLAHTIKEQCPSQFYFAPGRASWDDYGPDGMDLTEREFEIICNLPEGAGDFLLKQNRTSVRAGLPLRGLDDELAVISGRTKTVELFNEILDEGITDPVTQITEFHARRRGRVMA